MNRKQHTKSIAVVVTPFKIVYQTELRFVAGLIRGFGGEERLQLDIPANAIGDFFDSTTPTRNCAELTFGLKDLGDEIFQERK